MNIKNGRVYTASMMNLSNKLDRYGDANIENLSLLKLLYKYCDYCTTHKQLMRLDEMVNWLQINDSLICSEITAQRGSDYVWIPPAVDNTALETNPPIIIPTGSTITTGNILKTFSSAEIFEGYSDPLQLTYSAFSIKSLPTTGTLTYNGAAVVLNSQLTDPTLLVYTRDGDAAYADSFGLTAWNSSSFAALESATVTYNMTIESQTDNQPATVGDRAQYSGNRATTVFSSADFTTQPIAPYFDPEGNELDAIRINEVSTANAGTYFYFGSAVVEGQIITKEELNAGAFYHVGQDANGISTDSFNASVRDNVNMTWVS
tara:strand:+ start:6943 stop:7896 length:954 start_codon:yes stop_codon:yes gene_type:complete